jgi:hypothetical protein
MPSVFYRLKIGERIILSVFLWELLRERDETIRIMNRR